jgi:choline dehydrogenase-like flavoprotein
MAQPLEADVVIVGAGVAGTLVGWVLTSAGATVLILEAGPRVDRAQAVETYRRAVAKTPESPYPDVPYAPRPTVLDLRCGRTPPHRRQAWEGPAGCPRTSLAPPAAPAGALLPRPW